MRCFYHQERDAIGICKACHKGLCAECAADLGHGLACKDRHEADVQLLHDIVARSARVYATVPRARFILPLFQGFMGILFMGWGLRTGDGITSFPFLLGAGFAIFGIVILLANNRAYGPNSQEPGKSGRE